MSYIPPTTEGWTSQAFGTNPGGYNPAGGHTGEDIAVPVGTPLVAMADGVVVHVGYFTGKYSDNPWWIMPSFAGFVVTVDYGEYLSHYAHCSGSPVLSGRRVRQGEVVAYSGNTGSATSGPHCHWEVMRNGWNLQSSTYGRINPRDITGSAAIAPQGTINEGGLTVADINTISKQLAELLERTDPISTSGGDVSLRQFIADGTRASQAAKDQTSPINTSAGQVSLKQFVADGTRAAQQAVAKQASLEAALKAVVAAAGSTVDLAAVTAAAEAGATKALSNLTASVTIEQAGK